MHVMIRNASKNRLEVLRPAMSADEQLAHPILGEPIRCRAVRTLREVSEDAGAATACHCALGVPSSGSYLCVPMLAAGELVGVTNLQAAEAGHFTPDRVRALQGYVGFTSATVSSLRLIAATRERALRDGLTGAYNRAFLAEYLHKTLASARRRGAPLAVLMVDLDHFKRINDEHGHPAGDAAIIALARCLQAQTRTNDAVVRYGGEEFCVLLVDVAVEAARATAERIRAAIERTAVGELGPILRASIGVAAFPDHAGDDAALIAAADAALYRAKAAGRNRVELARAPA
jgi:diguanylate cyclase (GGDEF)-like protein